jgi:hypothetical protein
MVRRVGLARNDVSEERIPSIIRVTRIGELGTLAVTSNRRTLRMNTNVVPSSPIHVAMMMEAIPFSKTSVLTRATLRHITEDGILDSQHRENLKSYISASCMGPQSNTIF